MRDLVKHIAWLIVIGLSLGLFLSLVVAFLPILVAWRSIEGRADNEAKGGSDEHREGDGGSEAGGVGRWYTWGRLPLLRGHEEEGMTGYGLLFAVLIGAGMIAVAGVVAAIVLTYILYNIAFELFSTEEGMDDM